MKNKLLLLCGPSGTGKSTLARMLINIDKRFRPVPVYTSRRMREGEQGTKDKIFVSVDSIKLMYEKGNLLNLDCPYDIPEELYGIHKNSIQEIFDEGNFPVLDHPAHRIKRMRTFFPVFAVILITPDEETWLNRLSDRDTTGKRKLIGINELRELEKYKRDADTLLINHENNLNSIANLIYSRYIYFVNSNQ